MIDFHTHILHNIDDGPRTLDLSVQMARAALQDGTTTIIATPHAPDQGRYRVARVYERLAELREALDEAALPLEVVPGSELLYDSDMVARLKAGDLLTIGNSHTVLVECPIYEPLPAGFNQLVFELQVAGYRVVLAHPERIKDVSKDPNALIPLIERGVLMQLTTQALIGDQGDSMQHLAETLLTHAMIHILASDAHGVPPYRPPLLSKARQRAAELVGEDTATALVLHTPRALLDDLSFDLPTPQPVRNYRRRWL
jgi:protein-tyrosine phosphatase